MEIKFQEEKFQLVTQLAKEASEMEVLNYLIICLDKFEAHVRDTKDLYEKNSLANEAGKFVLEAIHIKRENFKSHLKFFENKNRRG